MALRPPLGKQRGRLAYQKSFSEAGGHRLLSPPPPTPLNLERHFAQIADTALGEAAGELLRGADAAHKRPLYFRRVASRRGETLSVGRDSALVHASTTRL